MPVRHSLSGVVQLLSLQGQIGDHCSLAILVAITQLPMSKEPCMACGQSVISEM